MNLQFHGTQKELIGLVKKTLDIYRLYMVCVQLFPEFQFKMISADEFDEKIHVIRDSSMIFLRMDEPELAQQEYMRFIEDNKNSLVFSFGKQADNLLEESSISTMATDPAALKLWKRIINGFKKTLHKGAWVVHSINGDMRFYKNHYYTPLSQKAYLEGCKMVQFEQLSSYYVLSHEAPDSEKPHLA